MLFSSLQRFWIREDIDAFVQNLQREDGFLGLLPAARLARVAGLERGSSIPQAIQIRWTLREVVVRMADERHLTVQTPWFIFCSDLG